MAWKPISRGSTFYSEVAFDLHYVNAQGNEISPDEALKAVKEKAATEMK